MPDQQKRTPIISERSPPARVFDIFLGEHVIDYYADGTARMSLGPEVSKIEFVRSMGPIEEEGLSVDQRDIFLRVAMPTSALIEL